MAIARVSTTINGAPPTAVASSTKSDAGSSDQDDQTVATRPAFRYEVFGVVIAGSGFAGGLYLQHSYHSAMANLPVLASGFGSLALIYIMAQAIERLLVPVSWFGGGFLGISSKWEFVTKEDLKKNRQSVLLQAERLEVNDPTQATPPSGGTSQNAAGKAKAKAESKHKQDQYTANLTGTTFGLSAGLAMVVSGYAGIFLLRTVGINTAPWLDLLVTGLVIAGGTKPLHDLISTISSTSQSNDSDTSS